MILFSCLLKAKMLLLSAARQLKCITLHPIKSFVGFLNKKYFGCFYTTVQNFLEQNSMVLLILFSTLEENLKKILFYFNVCNRSLKYQLRTYEYNRIFAAAELYKININKIKYLFNFTKQHWQT